MQSIRVLMLGGVIVASVGNVSPASAHVVEGEEYCVVNVATWDHLNVRDVPDSRGDIVTEHRYGDCGIVVVSHTEDGWVRIEDGHFEGWVNSQFLSMVSPAIYCVSNVDEDDTLNIRAYPSATSRVISELEPSQCDIAFLPYAVGGWQKIRLNVYSGWDYRKYLSAD
jgi:SH3-like domain-containing protein